MFGFFLIILAGVGIYLYRHLMRDRPVDRSAIDSFAEQSGLRIISVTRSYNYFRFFLLENGTRGLSSITRFYHVAAEDYEGHRGHFNVAFDPLFGSGQPTVLGSQGLTQDPSNESKNVSQPDLRMPPPSWTWYERLVLWGVGAGVSGFVFSGILQQYLSPPKRPVIPDVALGYTYLLEAKYGNAYGTYFEYLAVTYGVWAMWGLCAASCLVGYLVGVRRKSLTYIRQIYASAVISMGLYYAVWRVFVELAPQ
jgi:hypothetical protein